MKNSPYISQRTRDAAMRAIDDLPTDVLLNAMRQMPLSDYRRKELDDAYSKDVQEHRKTFRMDDDKPKAQKAPEDPARLLMAMTYPKAPKGPSAGETAGPKARTEQSAPLEGVPLGAFKLEKPKLPESDAPIYSGFKIDGSAGDGTSQSEVG